MSVKTKTAILSDDAGLYVMEALRSLIDRLEAGVRQGDRMIADNKSLLPSAIDYIRKRNEIEKRCCEEIKALIKEVRYERI